MSAKDDGPYPGEVKCVFDLAILNSTSQGCQDGKNCLLLTNASELFEGTLSDGDARQAISVMHKKAHLRIDVVRKLWDELAGRSESNLILYITRSEVEACQGAHISEKHEIIHYWDRYSLNPFIEVDMGYKLGCCVCLSFFFWKMGRIREGTTTMTDEHAKQLARSDATEQLPSNETTSAPSIPSKPKPKRRGNKKASTIPAQSRSSLFQEQESLQNRLNDARSRVDGLTAAVAQKEADDQRTIDDQTASRLVSLEEDLLALQAQMNRLDEKTANSQAGLELAIERSAKYEDSISSQRAEAETLKSNQEDQRSANATLILALQPYRDNLEAISTAIEDQAKILASLSMGYRRMENHRAWAYDDCVAVVRALRRVPEDEKMLKEAVQLLLQLQDDIKGAKKMKDQVDKSNEDTRSKILDQFSQASLARTGITQRSGSTIPASTLCSETNGDA